MVDNAMMALLLPVGRRRLVLAVVLAAAAVLLVVLLLLFFSLPLSPMRMERIRVEEYREQQHWNTLSHLVIVAGHAVFVDDDFRNVTADDAWWIEPYQKGQAATFVDHIRAGVTAANDDPSALLVFSGGATRKDAGPRTEAQSYWLVAEFSAWFHGGRSTTAEVRHRTVLEEYARDSFENLLFSICRFHEVTGRYPQRITLVSFAFKRARFLHLHTAAIRFPAANVDFIGIDPPFASDAQREHVLEQERVNALLPFTDDPFGCREPLLSKKLSRDPFLRNSHAYHGAFSCPQLQELLSYCGDAFPEWSLLPWDHDEMS